jgi:hypothetical protein
MVKAGRSGWRSACQVSAEPIDIGPFTTTLYCGRGRMPRSPRATTDWRSRAGDVPTRPRCTPRGPSARQRECWPSSSAAGTDGGQRARRPGRARPREAWRAGKSRVTEPHGECVSSAVSFSGKKSSSRARAAPTRRYQGPHEAHVPRHPDLEKAGGEPGALGREPKIAGARPTHRRTGATTVDGGDGHLRHRSGGTSTRDTPDPTARASGGPDDRHRR